jgi:hypothetical protein
MKIEIITNADNNPVAEFFSSSNTPETNEAQHEGLLRGNPMPTQVVHVNFAQKLERERDEAREVAKEADEGHDMAIADLAKCEVAAEKVVVRANELIARWDQPSWKDTAPTARFINALRIAVRAYERET